jgi:hypothetical protein
MKPLAPGTLVFHRHRGYGVITMVNLLTGWISARFGNEKRSLDLNLMSDEIHHADGEPILFRHASPDRMPHARLMEMVRTLHRAGYQRLYLATWPKPSGLHWYWHLFAGPRNWLQRPLREGWHGSGAEYIFNPVLGWGDAPGASAEELIAALRQFDPQGLEQALGRDEDHSLWFEQMCESLLPGYMYSFERNEAQNSAQNSAQATMSIVPVRRGVNAYQGPALPWPPGWGNAWQRQIYALPPERMRLV